MLPHPIPAPRTSRRLVALVTALALAFALVPGAPCARAAALGTAFTYQGRIDRNGQPATDTYSFVFRLYDAASGGAQVGTDQVLNGVTATNGLFTVSLDFGAAAFTGQGRWLDIQAKGSADANYTALTPRQALTAVPYALYALSAPGAGGSSPWIVGADGLDLTYPNGGVGITGHSSPFVGAGNGVFIEGGYAAGGYIFGFDYSANTTKDLLLQSPGGRVGIGTTTPVAKLEVNGQGRFTNNGRLSDPLGYPAALYAFGYTGTGILGTSSMGVYAASVDQRGVYGVSTNDLGVVGENVAKGNAGWLGGLTEGVFAQATTLQSYGARFVNTAAGGIALRADGLAQVKTLQILGGADLAERFESAAAAEPGTVMAIDPEQVGRVRVADRAYCRTVAGVVSGANDLQAGVTLSREESSAGTVPLALTGRVWVKCDATRSPIHPGDLLTTAERAGHAMVARDHDRAQGAILGKAMSSLESGTGLVLVLVSLQ